MEIVSFTTVVLSCLLVILGILIGLWIGSWLTGNLVKSGTDIMLVDGEIKFVDGYDLRIEMEDQE